MKSKNMSHNVNMLEPEFDLTDCDKEPIHIPSFIQPHGVLFVLKEPQLTILQVSNNTTDFFGIPPWELIDRNLNVILDNFQIDDLKNTILSAADLQTINPLKIDIILNYKSLKFDALIHRSNGGLILELEPAIAFKENSEFLSFYHLVRAAASKIQSTSDLNSLGHTLVKEIRNLTEFDRVMLYKFDREENGKVMAEDKQENLDSFLGLQYPSSDIPKQARKLYALNWLRLIADINYQPVEIVPANNPLINAPIDLSFSVLRSVSPIHIEYLQNMGIGASMSISLMKDGKLWGLIACHHQSPKHVSYEVRKACEFLGQVMSLELFSKEENEDYEYKIKLKSLNAKVLESMSSEIKFSDGLFKDRQNLLDLVGARGAAACLNGECKAIGETPHLEEINYLMKLLEKNFKEDVFYTDCLAKLYPEAEKFKEVASGLLAISISKTQNHYILWFRPEVIQTVNWAGNPSKSIEIESDSLQDSRDVVCNVSTASRSLRLSPRKSFELWKETVKLKSLPWKECEIEAARELRNAIISIVLRKAEELAKLNAALQESEAREREKAQQLEVAMKELQQTQTRLVQSEKMSSLGQLVAGVAHEINNPVNFIYGNLGHADNYSKDLISLLNIYAKYYPQAVPEIRNKSESMDLEFLLEDLPKLLKSMKVGVDRIRDLVLSLRNFSRVDEAEMKPVNIHDGIDSTLLILSPRLKAKPDNPGIQIVKEYGNFPLVECYAGQLNQVFMNIIANAIDALEESNKQRSLKHIIADPNRIIIRTEVRNRENELGIDSQSPNPNSRYVAISIADNGPGMTEEVRQRLFDPFFTTKPLGKGTGLGLAISYEIVVQKHGGNLKCVSKPGLGTEFWIEIPLQAKR